MEFNFSKLNYNVQSIFFRAKAFKANNHSQWLFRIRTDEFKFSKLKLKGMKFATSARAIVGMSALYPAEKPKEEAEGTGPTWSTRIQSATGPFPSAYFRTKVRSKGFIQEIKKAFSPKKKCEQNNKSKKGTHNVVGIIVMETYSWKGLLSL